MGIGAGFVAYVLIKVVRGKISEIHGLMWVVAGLFVLYRDRPGEAAARGVSP